MDFVFFWSVVKNKVLSLVCKTKTFECTNMTGVPEGDKSNKYDCIIVYCEKDEDEVKNIQNELLKIELNDEKPLNIELEEYVGGTSFKRPEHLQKLKDKALFICVLISDTITDITKHEYHELLNDNHGRILPILLHPRCMISGFQSLNCIDWTNKHKLDKFKNIVIKRRKRD
ncbi:uncharacterized protein LOC106880740 isoform X2 [Octopus bimaculoides]|uniref:uncharacterized protein LOC106880740 isoform X2 n=1 Tax=Octopus bimaculoides TaxID=37653 RepID=UPI00071C2F6D|nr:uncharacterized protein LOC106880740 isoform X2 [Octopus bimaculoides]|eukprot:XP_014786317.1 PREDICTED: uncharacterized protein LOC106880740 isoform X2 [Octopus bimaculoides]